MNILQELIELPDTKNSELSALRNIPTRLSLHQFNVFPTSPEHLENRNKILRLEDEIHRLPGGKSVRHDFDFLTPTHEFRNGKYKRSLKIPANILVVGMRHAISHFVILAHGRAVCFTERGKEFMCAGDMFFSPAGEKRVVLADVDCEWTTIHETSSLSSEEFERKDIIRDYAREQMHDRMILQNRIGGFRNHVLGIGV